MCSVRGGVIARVVDIGGIVDHHSLNFLLITLKIQVVDVKTCFM